MAEVHLRLSYKGSNVKQHIAWLQYLLDPLFWENAKERMQSKPRLQKLVAMARLVIQQEIYSYANYQGDGKIAESATAEGTLDGFGLYFDPAISGAKGPFSSGNPSEFSYAAFFEKPLEFNSFIQPRDTTEPSRYRPFMQPLTEGYKVLSDANCLEAIRSAMKLKRPRQI